MRWSATRVARSWRPGLRRRHPRAAARRDATGARALRRRRRTTRPVQAGDIAVLVRSNDDADAHPARRCRAPASRGRRRPRSLFATDAGARRAAPCSMRCCARRRRPPARRAGDAAVRPGRRRASPRFDNDAPRTATGRCARWPGASAGSGTGRWRCWPTCAREQAPRLLALADGERRLTNYLQLAEAAGGRRAARRPAGLVDWLRRASRTPTTDDERSCCAWNRTRGGVQIMTLHMSKGLIPAGVPAVRGDRPRAAQRADLCEFHDGARPRAAAAQRAPRRRAAWSKRRTQQDDGRARRRRAPAVRRPDPRAPCAVAGDRTPFAQADRVRWRRCCGDARPSWQARAGRRAASCNAPALPLTAALAPLPPRAQAMPCRRRAGRAPYRCARLVGLQLHPARQRAAGDARRGARRARRPKRAARSDEPDAAAADGARASPAAASATCCTARWNASTSRPGATGRATLPPTRAGRARCARRCAARATREADIDEGVPMLTPLVGHTLNARAARRHAPGDVPPEATRWPRWNSTSRWSRAEVPRCWRCCIGTAWCRERRAFGLRQRGSKAC